MSLSYRVSGQTTVVTCDIRYVFHFLLFILLVIKKSLHFIFQASRVVRETVLVCSEPGRREKGDGGAVGSEETGLRQAKRMRGSIPICWKRER